MHSPDDVPEEYHQFFFVNAGGPSRKVLSRKVVQKKWQFVTLDCSHRVLVSKYQKASKICCGFCGGLDPLSKKGSRGGEPADAKLNIARTLRKSDLERDANSDAVDATLQELIDAWPKLPRAVREALVALVRAASRS